MRSRGSYKIASAEEGKVAELDQSYRSCLMALIFVFFMCIIMILACLFVQKSEKDYQSIIAMRQTSSNTGGRASNFTQDSHAVTTAATTNQGNDILPLASTTEASQSDSTRSSLTSTIATRQTSSTTDGLPDIPDPDNEVQRNSQDDADQTQQSPPSLADNVGSSKTTSIESQSYSTEIVTHNSTQPIPRPTLSTEDSHAPSTTAATTNQGNDILVLASTPETSRSDSTRSSLTSTITTRQTSSNTDGPPDIPDPDNEVQRNLQEDSDHTPQSPPSLADHFGSSKPTSIESQSYSTELGTHNSTQPIPRPTLSTEDSHAPSTTAASTKEGNDILALASSTETSGSDSTQSSSTSIIAMRQTSSNADGPPDIPDPDNEVERNSPPDDSDETPELFLADNVGSSKSTSIESQSYSTEFVTHNSTQPAPRRVSLSTQDSSALLTAAKTKQRNDISAVASSTETSRSYSIRSALSYTQAVISEANTTPSPPDNSTFTLNACDDIRGSKQIASKILSYMDHWGNQCQDFYEYACGGFEAGYQITGKDLSRRVYDTIKQQAEKRSNHSSRAQFNRYYDSCLDYEVTYNISERVKLAKKALEKIGNFSTRKQWENIHETEDLTKIFTNILQNDWALLFDIVPDVDKADSEHFTLTIGPRQLVFDSKPFQFRHEPDRCKKNDGPVSEGNCKENTERLIDSIKETLSALHIVDNLPDDDVISPLAIYTGKIEGILKKYSSERKILEAYRSKDYTVMFLDDLQGDRRSINWTQLIGSLTESDLRKDATLYVYNEKELIEALNELEKLWKDSPRDLNNALLGLYAHYLYNTFVTPKSLKDLHNDCLYKAVHSMKDIASELYVQSFETNEIQRMKKLVKNNFEALKETMRLNIEKIKWATQGEREKLLKKLDDMRCEMPPPERLEGEETNKLDINDNYFENSMKLMKTYRTTMYSMIKKKPLNEIWRFFASSFESIAQTIYPLNLIAIPYGAVEVDVKTLNATEDSMSYMTLATVGNVIARQIAQNFDTTAMRYGNVITNDKTKGTYENEYVACHQSLYDNNTVVIDDRSMTGARTVNVHFQVPTMSLNERLSEIVGLRLARDTLDRLRSNSTQPLPWLNLNVIQLFYLTYVQAQCTKAPLASSLNEDPFLASRKRVYVATNNHRLFLNEWDCPPPTAAHLEPECRAFPHLDNDG